MLKVELHTHTADDPIDRIPYSTTELIDRAALLGYDALAITLHERQLDLEPWRGYAADRHLTLIPGIERTIEGKHVLLLNFATGAEQVSTFAELDVLKRSVPGLVVAPHPFFPHGSCLGGLLDRHAHLFDAVEYNGMFMTGINFNRAAERWARAQGKPLVGNGDVHRLSQLGTTFSLVDAERDPAAICAAVREGRVTVEAHAHTWTRGLSLVRELILADYVGLVRGRWPVAETEPPLLTTDH